MTGEEEHLGCLGSKSVATVSKVARLAGSALYNQPQ